MSGFGIVTRAPNHALLCRHRVARFPGAWPVTRRLTPTAIAVILTTDCRWDLETHSFAVFAASKCAFEAGKGMPRLVRTEHVFAYVPKGRRQIAPGFNLG